MDYDVLEDEAVIVTGFIQHEAGDDDEDSSDDETLEDIYNGFSEKEKEVVHYMIGAALEAASTSMDDAASGVTHSATDGDDTNGNDGEGADNADSDGEDADGDDSEGDSADGDDTSA